MVTTSTHTAERRAFERVPHHTRAVLSTRQGEIQADVVDVSVGGLGLQTTGAIRCGDFVRVRLPLDSGDAGEWVDPDAIVVRVVPDPSAGTSTVGLAFCDLSERTRAQLSARVSASRFAAAAHAGPTRRVATTTPPPDPREAELAAERQALRDLVVGATQPSKRPSPARGAPSRFVAVLASAFGRRSRSASGTAKTRR